MEERRPDFLTEQAAHLMDTLHGEGFMDDQSYFVATAKWILTQAFLLAFLKTVTCVFNSIPCHSSLASFCLFLTCNTVPCLQGAEGAPARCVLQG